MRVRVVDHLGEVIGEGELCGSPWRDPCPSSGSRRGVAFGSQEFEAPPSLGHCSVRFDAQIDVPLWYGGTYREKHLDFTLPSGLHNVWGCGNDFDTDASRIHPDDLAAIMKDME